MRTTIDLDDDLLSALKPVAAAEGRSLGRVVSDLVRSALRADRGSVVETGFPVFALPADARLFGPDEVARALDE